MHGPGHPLQGVGYNDRPSRFDQLSRAASSLDFLPSHIPTASTSQLHAPASSNGDQGPSPPDHPARPTKKSRKSSSGPAGTGNGEEEGPLKKKAKQTLSCSECKRRKIKCDRCQPCSACVKRGAPNDCWEDAKIEPERQPFALAEDLDEMKERLQLLERFINKLPIALKNQSFAELGINSMGPLKRESLDEIGRSGHQMFENMERLDNGTCPEMYSLPNECFPTVDNTGQDNFELLENAVMIVSRAPERRGVELTDGLTSILAPRPIWVDSSTSTKMGLDLCFTETEFHEERKRTLDKIFTILPNKADSHKAVDRYEKGFHWMFPSLHMPSLRAEHKKYWEMVESGRRDDIDPGWLAVYAVMLALSWDDSAQILPEMFFDGSKDSPEAKAKKEHEALSYYAVSQKLILLADPYGKPQVRFIQQVLPLQFSYFFETMSDLVCFSVVSRYVILNACWTLIAAVDSSDWGRFSNLLCVAIRTGHNLQLHRLTDDPENMPSDDPAWPPGKNSVKRESALRIWSALTFYDHLAAISRFSTYMIHPDHTTTPILSNVDSVKLSSTEWKIEVQPDSAITDATLERHKYKLAEISRKTFDMFVAGKKSFNYGAVLELDREYRTILETMPDAWIQEHKSLEEKDPYLKSRRFGALQAVHNRIVRLHRPFLTRGYAPNSKFSYSTDACIRSAKIVLVCHHNNVGFIIKPLYSHSLSASIVLAADLFHHIDNGATTAEIESKKEHLLIALEIFSEQTEKKIQSRHLQAIIGQARRILSGLFFEVEKRRARRMARVAQGRGGEPVQEEPFNDILSRIAREDPTAPIAANQQPRPALPQQQPVPQPDLSTSQAFPPSFAPNPATLASYSLPTPASYASSDTLNNGSSSSFPGMQPDPSQLFSNTFLSDLGLLNVDGHMLDYYGQPPSNGSGSAGGPSPSDTVDLSFLGFSSEFNGGAVNPPDATQALFSTLTGGW
ncbi:hypothetical protein JCM5353_002777 [Sporobolomyces roseus]